MHSWCTYKRHRRTGAGTDLGPLIAPLSYGRVARPRAPQSVHIYTYIVRGQARGGGGDEAETTDGRSRIFAHLHIGIRIYASGASERARVYITHVLCMRARAPSLSLSLSLSCLHAAARSLLLSPRYCRCCIAQSRISCVGARV